MKKLKVFLQHPLKFSDSQYYKSMIAEHPRGVEYVSENKNVGIISNNYKFKYFDKFKWAIRELLNLVPLPIINSWKTTSEKEFDIIHCAHCLSENKSPWVADFEFVSQMWGGTKDIKSRRDKVRKLITSMYCKKIIAWTEDSKKDILNVYPEIKDKIEVITYGMKRPLLRPKNKSKELVLFFSGRHFYAKGGLHATEAIDRITKKYPNVRGVINGAISEEVISKYSGNKKLKFYQLMPYGEVLKLYRDSDIFIYPGYSDSFGFIFMDAMVFGVPIVTVDGFARKEIIREGKTGFILDRPNIIDENGLLKNEKTIRELVAKTEMLIKDKKLRADMSKEGVWEIKDGKFSIEKRNKKLKKIYEEALK